MRVYAVIQMNLTKYGYPHINLFKSKEDAKQYQRKSLDDINSTTNDSYAIYVEEFILK